MSDKQIDGLGFDKLVFDYMEKEAAQSTGERDRGALNLGVGEKEIGLAGPAILRAVSAIRAKGYPVISNSTRRTWENDFVIPKTQKDYLAWRDKMVDDIRALEAILKSCDAGAKAQWGVDLPMQQVMF